MVGYEHLSFRDTRDGTSSLGSEPLWFIDCVPTREHSPPRSWTRVQCRYRSRVSDTRLVVLPLAGVPIPTRVSIREVCTKEGGRPGYTYLTNSTGFPSVCHGGCSSWRILSYPFQGIRLKQDISDYLPLSQSCAIADFKFVDYTGSRVYVSKWCSKEVVHRCPGVTHYTWP